MSKAKSTRTVEGEFTPSGEITLALPIDVNALAAQQADAEAELTVYRTMAIATDADYEFADALLSEVVRKIDSAVAVRKSATGPIYVGLRQVEGWFRPLLEALGQGRDTLKQIMREHMIAKEALAKAARLEAAAAAKADEPDALVQALTAATQAEARPDARARITMHWAPTVVDSAMVPREYLMIDMVALAKLGREHAKGDAPEVPGVTWARTADVAAKR